MNTGESVKVIHMYKKFPHGWYAACGREITAHTATVTSWSEVTCKNCKLKQLSGPDIVESSDLYAGITSKGI